MAQQTFALMTNKGRAKEAVALASGNSISITHIAIGSGETVPSGGETKLYREVLRKAISANGLVSGTENTAYFDIFLSASEGPFTIREAGLFDSEGDLIAIASYDPPINKPVPASGQTVEGIIRIEVAFSNVANITIKVDPSLNVPLQRLTTTPWIPVKSITVATPPANPIVGDSYIIASNPTGLWAGQAGKLSEFTQAGWTIITTPNGHGVGLPDGRVFTKVNGQYVEVLASISYVNNYRIPSKQLLTAPFVPVESMVLTTPPTNPTQGKAYLVPANATGLWAGKGGQLAEWDGASWAFTVTPNGHSIGLPDGRIFTCINNQYSENIALDSQSGKWSYATASVDGSTYIAQVTPAPTAIPAGFAIRVKMPAINTGPILLGVNQFPPRPVYYRDTNEALVGNDWLPGVVVEFIFDGGNWRFNTSFSYINRKISLDSQSGKWNYAEAGGTANALTTTLDLKPLALTAGIGLQLKIKTNNTGAATLNLNNLGVKPIIYHETGEPLVGGDFQIGDVINLVFDGTSWRLQPSLAYMDKRYSRLVPPPTDTFYVNATTGNDSNNGFTATTAFKSLQGAVDAINSRYMTVGKITVRVAAGTYQGFVLTNSYVTDWDFVGDANSPNNVKIDASTVSSTKRGILLANVKVTINGFSILSYWDGINVNTNSDVIVRNCSFQGFNSSVAYGLSTFGGRLRVFGTISFSGTFVSAFFNSGGSLAIGYTDGVTTENVRITYVAGIVCAAANLISENGGLTALTPSTITFVGNPATPKFIAAVNGFIRAYGAGINFLPGTQAGVIATGGQYV